MDPLQVPGTERIDSGCGELSGFDKTLSSPHPGALVGYNEKVLNVAKGINSD